MITVTELLDRANTHYMLANTLPGADSMSVPPPELENLIRHNIEMGDKWLMMARTLQRELDFERGPVETREMAEKVRKNEQAVRSVIYTLSSLAEGDTKDRLKRIIKEMQS